ncbi:Tyrosine recombinase XerC [Paraburkholderia nemoris]|uniref:tyrosine-type recombinase/integrase n=1 Tax=Paraburkholderia nemoris TaxID=2793076 RepID=UPI00190A82F4|nr:MULTISPECIES: tyrosine-type recombinase/integrase [Paraburkholderia]MBK3786296.1 tyrosine-type recombinase/integrase [Paraburkholderia aspalathi]CAE6850770.1 Tyrosine recombinase XerC [Paraburkholderia nemoris]
MKPIWPDTDRRCVDRFIWGLGTRNATTTKVYRCILSGFQRFVMQRACARSMNKQMISAWLHERATQWPMHIVFHRARLVDRFLDFLVSEGSIANNPLRELRIEYGQRTTTPVVRALLSSSPETALDALRLPQRFGSFLGPLMRDHVTLMRAMGYRYETQANRFAYFDRYLQKNPGLEGQPLAVLLRDWHAIRPTPEHAWLCQELGRDLAKALRRFDPMLVIPKPDLRLRQQLKQQRRGPYIYTEQEVQRILETAQQYPSPCAPLRPMSLYTMLVLAYCTGLRLGEIVGLNLGDVHLDVGEIDIRETKFFKSRTLPVSNSVAVVLHEYVNARRRAGAPQQAESGLFWHQQRAGRYSYVMTEKLLTRVLRLSRVKPDRGGLGPRIHDLRHTFVANRMLAWYREGINPQARLPYLATYLGHRDINSTLVYLTITQELLQQAGARFRSFGAHSLHVDEGVDDETD